MNMKQFRKPAYMQGRTAIVGGRGFRHMSKIGQQAISFNRLAKITANQRKINIRTAANTRAICASVMKKSPIHGSTMVLTMTPEAHDGHLDEWHIYNAQLT